MSHCIEFSYNSIKFCSITKKKGRFLIEHLAVFDAPEGKIQQAASGLKSYLDEEKISFKEYGLLIPTHLAAVRFLKLPSGDPREIKDMVGWQAAKQLPYSPEEIVYSYHIISTEGQGSSNIILFIARKDNVEKYLKALDSLGAHPAYLSLSCEGLKLLYDFQVIADASRKQENTVLIEIDFDSLCVSLRQRGNLEFTRGISLYGGCPETDKYISEIMLSLDTYRKLEFARKIDRIVVSGPGELIPKVIEALGPDINLPIETIDYKRGLEFAEGKAAITIKKQYTFASCLGASLGASDIKVNLLPQEVLGQASSYHSRRQLLKTAGIALGVMALIAGIYVKRIQDKNSLLAYLNRELGTLGENTIKLDEKARRLELINKQVQKGSSVLDAISEVYKAVPAGITFSSIVYEQDDNITIRGNAGQMSLVFKFVSNLEAVSHFSGVQVGYVTKRKMQYGQTVDFEINAPIKG